MVTFYEAINIYSKFIIYPTILLYKEYTNSIMTGIDH